MKRADDLVNKAWRERWERTWKTVRNLIQTYIELNQTKELQNYLSRLVQQLEYDPEHMQSLLGILDEECPAEADKFRKMLLLQ